MNNSAPTVISLFSGCGGSSLGYRMAGYRELLAVEWDANAVETFRLNFPEVPVYHGDIAALSVKECMELAGIGAGELDVLDGSPPCQGFSMAGKRKMTDDRNQLFREYCRLLNGLRPRAFIMENVAGMVRGKMKLIAGEIFRELEACGYRVKAQLMNAMYFGVPQSRERMIFVGVREDLGVGPTFPRPQGRPVTVREAWHDLKTHDQEGPQITPLRESRWRETRRGHNHHERFALVRLAWNRPASTIMKVSGSGGHMHPDEPRLCSVSELRRLASFPDTFKFAGSFDHGVNRIGNSVPPLFMKAIAQYVAEHILTASPPAAGGGVG